MSSAAQKPVKSVPAIPEAFHGQLALFILAGQSNMSGRGELPSEQSANPRVFMFANDYRWRVATEPIDDPSGQVDEVSKDGDAGFGPGLTFALSLLRWKPDMLIGLIPCAKGASSIAAWQRHLSEDSLYGSCLKRIRAATTVGTVAGLLFFQGETDALDPAEHPNQSPSPFSYASKFSAFLHDLRGEISQLNLPVVFTQIGTHAAQNTYRYWNHVKEQQKKSDVSCAAMITTDDLAIRDAVHFTTESYQIIGERYAEAFLNLTSLMPHCR
jgi:hypothetical protein